MESPKFEQSENLGRYHKSVLQKEVIRYLDPKPNENFVDCTLGQAGHSKSILEKNAPKGKVLGIEVDNKLYQHLLSQKTDRLVLVNDSFVNLKEVLKKNKFERVCGVLMDLGISSWHLEESKRGFSFQKDEPLDMRYDASAAELTAMEILNQWIEKEIKKILREYGEERFASRIAEAIINARKQKPINTTFQLVDIIGNSVPGFYRHQRRHFATKTFQALRIAVNNELSNLEKTLPQILEILEKGGRVVVISFHSLEDRIVKNYFREKKKQGLLKVLTKKPIAPSETEIKINPRSRSAKLRAAIKLL